MTMEEIKEPLMGDEEMPPLLEDQETDAKPRRIALFVEPSPFAYISGYKNRFQNFIKNLREMGDEVIVITTHEGAPQEFHGAKIIGSRRYTEHSADQQLEVSVAWLMRFPCPMYNNVPLSLALSPRIISEIAKFKPDIIHASSPGIMVFGALAIAKMLSIPIVMSYHTHIPKYIPRYTWGWFVEPMWMVIRFLHRAADLTLVPSAATIKDLVANNVTEAHKIRLWNKGIDSKSFHPRYCSSEMRARLRVMDRLPGVRIAIIGDGPYRAELEKLLSGMSAVFTGMLQGEELSQAYASGDVFVMPSESETLGQVVLESMSSGTPVVAARAGGIPDIIPEDHEGKTSFLFSPGDLDDCVHKVEQLLSRNDFREAMAKAAREEMEKHDWGAATRVIRNENYNAAIWFWKKNESHIIGPIQSFARWLFGSPENTCS
ncbi:hypothetical protein ZIOFF_057882 [Zingiber officinale]|uniref:Glycosyltransferase subfamily 4-like N-terminal domain-containing protein n=1 Tax=Zingiber officinale TaxID=94328 RepID=A0A8J5F462_ZINOF|nr:hypothetical protein ZIOFF_057882 [Zingiber officinale]